MPDAKLLAVGGAVVIIGAIFGRFIWKKRLKALKGVPVLIGDVGGTNIRLELVVLNPQTQISQRIIKKENYLVSRFNSFENSLRQFLKGVVQYPKIAVIAIAGPLQGNKIRMANVPKWGQLSGQELGRHLNIPNFRFLNDFEASSYGILLVPPEKFQSINDLPIQSSKTRGVIGPGTGLGTSVLFPSPHKKITRDYVLPAEGGHTDFPYIDEEAAEYFRYMRAHSGHTYINLERSFCGPSIPFMFKFFKEKFPADTAARDQEAPINIIDRCLRGQKSDIYEGVLRMLLKIYGAAVGNFISNHMCSGGVYMVGSLTNSLLPKLNNTFLDLWLQRHPEVSGVMGKVPLVVCHEIDLGLKGALAIAGRIIADQQLN